MEIFLMFYPVVSVHPLVGWSTRLYFNTVLLTSLGLSFSTKVENFIYNWKSSPSNV